VSWQAGSTSGEETDDPDVTEGVTSAPRRPLTVEFGTAVLGIGGAFGIVQKLLAPAILPTGITGFDSLYVLLIVLDVIAVVAAIRLRQGSGWILAANVAAVYAFLHLATFALTGIVLSVVYLAVVAACYLSREWFDGMRDWRVARFEARTTR
jgi:hypothetical protein